MLKGFPRRQETQILAEELTCLFSLYPVSSPEALGKVLLAPEAPGGGQGGKLCSPHWSWHGLPQTCSAPRARLRCTFLITLCRNCLSPRLDP